jgi:glycosyltransferase involved in cell wall biosynthesis
MDRPLKITIVTGPWFPTPPGPAGAVERVWGDLARHFVRKGHSVLVLSRAHTGLPADETKDGVRTLRLTQWNQGKNVYLDILKDAAFSSSMLGRMPKADIAVTNAFWLPAMVKLLAPGSGRVSMNVQRVPKGHMWLYRRVDRLSAVSTAIADAIVKERPELAPRVRVIPNPIDVGFFKPPASRDYANASGSGRTITYTGRVHPEKGVHVLVEAFTRLYAEFPDLRLRIIGPSRVDRGGGGDEYVAKLKGLAAGKPVVIDEPIYDRARLAEALQQATYYCYPTLAEQGEAQPVAPMEAMACGLAPIVSDIPQFRDYLRDGEHGVTYNHRSGDLAANLSASIRRLVADPALATQLGDAATRQSQQFSYDLVADQYLADFRGLLGG